MSLLDEQKKMTSAPAAPASDGSSADSASLKAMQDKIVASVPPEQQDALDRVVIAGKKLLYSPQTAAMLREELDSGEAADKQLAGAAAGLMAELNRQAGGKIPPGVYIPGAAVLLLDVAGVMVDGGRDVSAQDVRDGLDQMSAAIQSNHGVPPDAVHTSLAGGAPAQAAALQPESAEVPA